MSAANDGNGGAGHRSQTTPRRLEDMSLEELWQLFPIVLAPHRSEWVEWFHEESRRLLKSLSAPCVAPWISRLSHVGSTAVPGILAKPTVDILMETAPEADMEAIARILVEESNGDGEGEVWRVMGRSAAPRERISLNKGYTVRGFASRVFHLHLRRRGDCDELYFRDWLLGRPDEAKSYEALKLDLWKRFEHDRDGYTAAKGDFVRRCVDEAKKAFPGRY